MVLVLMAARQVSVAPVAVALQAVAAYHFCLFRQSLVRLLQIKTVYLLLTLLTLSNLFAHNLAKHILPELDRLRSGALPLGTATHPLDKLMVLLTQLPERYQQEDRSDERSYRAPGVGSTTVRYQLVEYRGSIQQEKGKPNPHI